MYIYTVCVGACNIETADLDTDVIARKNTETQSSLATLELPPYLSTERT